MLWSYEEKEKYSHASLNTFYISLKHRSVGMICLLPANANWRPLISTDWPIFPTSIDTICLGVFLKSSLGGANISWERKNLSGGVIAGKKPLKKKKLFYSTSNFQRSYSISIVMSSIQKGMNSEKLVFFQVKAGEGDSHHATTHLIVQAS